MHRERQVFGDRLMAVGNLGQTEGKGIDWVQSGGSGNRSKDL